jgi:hypothetical protein
MTSMHPGGSLLIGVIARRSFACGEASSERRGEVLCSVVFAL